MKEVEKTETKFEAGKIPVFLVWSGTASGKIAKVLYHYLPRIIHVLEPWMSEEDAKKGSLWHSEIAGQLEKAHCGVLCLTKDNTGSDWIHFEAGILSKQVDKSHVCPFLIGLKASDLKYPLALFQNTVFTKDDSYRLIKTLNGICGKLALDELRLKESFNTYWPKIEEKLVEVEKEIAKPTVDKKAVAEASTPDEHIDELVLNTREILRQISRTDAGAKRSERSRSDRYYIPKEARNHENNIWVVCNDLNIDELIFDVVQEIHLLEWTINVEGDTFRFFFDMPDRSHDPMAVGDAFERRGAKVLDSNFKYF